MSSVTRYGCIQTRRSELAGEFFWLCVECVLFYRWWSFLRDLLCYQLFNHLHMITYIIKVLSFTNGNILERVISPPHHLPSLSPPSLLLKSCYKLYLCTYRNLYERWLFYMTEKEKPFSFGIFLKSPHGCVNMYIIKEMLGFFCFCFLLIIFFFVPIFFVVFFACVAC